MAVSGELGGLLEVEVADGDGTLGSAGTGELFSTSADMMWTQGDR